jgi:hypothetical protein
MTQHLKAASRPRPAEALSFSQWVLCLSYSECRHCLKDEDCFVERVAKAGDTAS